MANGKVGVNEHTLVRMQIKIGRSKLNSRAIRVSICRKYRQSQQIKYFNKFNLRNLKKMRVALYLLACYNYTHENYLLSEYVSVNIGNALKIANN